MSSKSNSIYKLICIQSQSILASSNSRQLRYICSLEKAQGKKLGLAQSVCISTSSHMMNPEAPKSKEHPQKAIRITTYPQTTVIAHRFFCGVCLIFVLLGPSGNVNVAFSKAHGASLRGLSDLQFLVLSPLVLSSDL